MNATQLGDHVACLPVSVPGGVMLASQVGNGDARLGGSYTSASITAVVPGGASVFAGRGSFIGASMGAPLIQAITTLTAFPRLGQAWQSALPGILPLVAAGLHARASGGGAATLAAS